MKKFLISCGLLAALAVPTTMLASDPLTLTFNVSGNGNNLTTSNVTVNAEGIEGVTATLNSIKMGDTEAGVQSIQGYSNYLCPNQNAGTLTTASNPQNISFTISGLPDGYQIENINLTTAACNASRQPQGQMDRYFQTNALINGNEFIDFGVINIAQGTNNGAKTTLGTASTPYTVSNDGSFELTISTYTTGTDGCFFGLSEIEFNYTEEAGDVYDINDVLGTYTGTIYYYGNSWVTNDVNVTITAGTSENQVVINNLFDPYISGATIKGTFNPKTNTITIGQQYVSGSWYLYFYDYNDSEINNIQLTVNSTTGTISSGSDYIYPYNWDTDDEEGFYGINLTKVEDSGEEPEDQYGVNDIIGNYTGTIYHYGNSWVTNDVNVTITAGTAENQVVINNLFDPFISGATIKGTFNPQTNTITIGQQYVSGSWYLYFYDYNDSEINKLELSVDFNAGTITSGSDYIYPYNWDTEDEEGFYGINLTKSDDSSNGGDEGDGTPYTIRPVGSRSIGTQYNANGSESTTLYTNNAWSGYGFTGDFYVVAKWVSQATNLTFQTYNNTGNMSWADAGQTATGYAFKNAFEVLHSSSVTGECYLIANNGAKIKSLSFTSHVGNSDDNASWTINGNTYSVPNTAEGATITISDLNAEQINFLPSFSNNNNNCLTIENFSVELVGGLEGEPEPEPEPEPEVTYNIADVIGTYNATYVDYEEVTTSGVIIDYGEGENALVIKHLFEPYCSESTNATFNPADNTIAIASGFIGTDEVYYLEGYPNYDVYKEGTVYLTVSEKTLTLAEPQGIFVYMDASDDEEDGIWIEQLVMTKVSDSTDEPEPEPEPEPEDKYDINEVVGTYNAVYADYDYNEFTVKDVVIALGASENALKISNLFPELEGYYVNATYNATDNTISVAYQWLKNQDGAQSIYIFEPQDFKASSFSVNDGVITLDDNYLYVYNYEDEDSYGLDMYDLVLTKVEDEGDEPEPSPEPGNAADLDGTYVANVVSIANSSILEKPASGFNVTIETEDNDVYILGLFPELDDQELYGEFNPEDNTITIYDDEWIGYYNGKEAWSILYDPATGTYPESANATVAEDGTITFPEGIRIYIVTYDDADVEVENWVYGYQSVELVKSEDNNGDDNNGDDNNGDDNNGDNNGDDNNGDDNMGSSAVDSILNDANVVIYNLHGIRVDNNKLTRGIYIINGKKVYVK